MRPGVFAWLVLAGGITFGGAAFAESAPLDPEALRLAADEFEAGRRAYKARDFEVAAVHFENADRVAPNADTLRGAIRARREARQPDRAATLAASALLRYPNNKSLRTYAESVISAAEKTLHKVEVSCEPSCSLALDNRVTPYESVDAAVLYVEPGDHAIVAGWSGARTKLAEIEAGAGTSSKLEFVAPEEPEPEPAVEAASVEPSDPVSADAAMLGVDLAAKPRAGLPPAVFWAGTGLTAVLGGVTLWSGLDTQSNPGPDKVRADCAGLGEGCPTYQDGLSKQRRTNVLLVATGAVGVATAIVGIFATDWDSSGDAPPATGNSLSPIVAVGDGVTLGAMGRF